MKRQLIRLGFALTLVLLTFFLHSVIPKNYSKDHDPNALFEIAASRLERDQAFYWLEIHLQKTAETPHNFRQKIILLGPQERTYQAADTKLAGTPETGVTDIWVKFWIEAAALDGYLNLELNNATLAVKEPSSFPELSDKSEAVFHSSNWNKKWYSF